MQRWGKGADPGRRQVWRPAPGWDPTLLVPADRLRSVVQWTPLLVAVVVADVLALVMVWGAIFGMLPDILLWIGAGLAMAGMYGFQKDQERK